MYELIVQSEGGWRGFVWFEILDAGACIFATADVDLALRMLRELKEERRVAA